LKFRDVKGKHIHDLDMGEGGTRHLYRDQNFTFLLIIDKAYDTVVMLVFDGDTFLPDFTIHLVEGEIKQYLGKRQLKQMPITIAKKMRLLVYLITDPELAEEERSGVAGLPRDYREHEEESSFVPLRPARAPLHLPEEMEDVESLEDLRDEEEYEEEYEEVYDVV